MTTEKLLSSKTKVTQQHIADLAGVSHVAVSYALNRPHLLRISEDKKREIQEIARELGYQPRKLTTRAIGLFVDLRNLGLNVVADTISLTNAALTQTHYSLVLLSGDAAHPEQFAQIEKLVDGVLVFDLEMAERAIPDTIPCVLIADADPQTLRPTLDWVAPDIVLATQRSTQHLLDYGHRRLALLVSDHESAFHSHLREGFFSAIANAGLPADAGCLLAVPNSGFIANAVQKAIAQPHSPTAILTVSSGHAGVVLTVLQDAGLRVPADMSLLSLEDGKPLSAMRPTITAHTQIERAIIDIAVERLLLRISKPARIKSPLRQLIPGSLIERASTGPAPAEN